MTVKQFDALSTGVGAAVNVKDMVRKVVPLAVLNEGKAVPGSGGKKGQSERSRKK